MRPVWKSWYVAAKICRSQTSAKCSREGGETHEAYGSGVQPSQHAASSEVLLPALVQRENAELDEDPRGEDSEAA